MKYRLVKTVGSGKGAESKPGAEDYEVRRRQVKMLELELEDLHDTGANTTQRLKMAHSPEETMRRITQVRQAVQDGEAVHINDEDLEMGFEYDFYAPFGMRNSGDEQEQDVVTPALPVQTFSLLDYAHLLPDEEEDVMDGVPDDEYDSNKELSDYPLSDPDSESWSTNEDSIYGGRRRDEEDEDEDEEGGGEDGGSEERERKADTAKWSRDALRAFTDGDQQRVRRRKSATPPWNKDSGWRPIGEMDFHNLDQSEQDRGDSVDWFGVSTDAEDDPTVLDQTGWHMKPAEASEGGQSQAEVSDGTARRGAFDLASSSSS